MDVTKLSTQGLPEEGNSHFGRAGEAAPGGDATRFLLELLKLIPGPAGEAATGESLSSWQTDTAEDGMELPSTGDILPVGLTLPGAMPPTPAAAQAPILSKAQHSAEMPMASMVESLVVKTSPDRAGALLSRASAGAHAGVDAPLSETAVELGMKPALAALAEVLTQSSTGGSTPNSAPAQIEGALRRLFNQDTLPQALQGPIQELAASFAPSASGGAAVGPGSPAGAERAPALELSIPFGEQGWDSGMAERVVWMVREQSQTATIRLNPPGLGPLNVSIQMQGEQATVQFHAPQAAVREALDVAVPRLRELLAESGVQLVGVDISQHGPGGHGGDAPREALPYPHWSAPARESDGVPDEPQAPGKQAQGAGLIDFYV